MAIQSTRSWSRTHYKATVVQQFLSSTDISSSGQCPDAFLDSADDHIIVVFFLGDVEDELVVDTYREHPAVTRLQSDAVHVEPELFENLGLEVLCSRQVTARHTVFDFD